MIAILQYGLSVAVVGILTVFVGLIILIAMIKVMEIALSATKKVAPVPTPISTPVPEPVAQNDEPEDEDDGELIAVLAAAVATVIQFQGEEPSGFVVRSIRRVTNAPAWNRAGREEQVYSRL